MIIKNGLTITDPYPFFGVKETTIYAEYGSVKICNNDDEEFSFIHSLYVEPEYRKKGHGTYLLDKAIGNAKYGVIGLKMESESLRGFYEKRGFTTKEGLWMIYKGE